MTSRVVQVVDDLGAPAGRDPPRDPAAHGDADARRDLLLEPHRRLDGQRVAALVEQQQDREVGVAEVAHAPQELGHELVQAEVGQADVGDRLEPLQALAGAALGVVQARVLERRAGPAAQLLARARGPRPP